MKAQRSGKMIRVLHILETPFVWLSMLFMFCIVPVVLVALLMGFLLFLNLALTYLVPLLGFII